MISQESFTTENWNLDLSSSFFMLRWSSLEFHSWSTSQSKGCRLGEKMESRQAPPSSWLWEILLLRFEVSVDEGAGNQFAAQERLYKSICWCRNDGPWLRNALCLSSLFPPCLLSVEAQTHSCTKSLVNHRVNELWELEGPSLIPPCCLTETPCQRARVGVWPNLWGAWLG